MTISLMVKTYTPSEAARELGVNTSVVQRAIMAGTLQAVKVPVVVEVWHIKADDLDQYRRTRRRGRPLGPKA